MKIALVCDSLGTNSAGFARYESLFIEWLLNNQTEHEFYIFLPDSRYKTQFKNHNKLTWINLPKGFKNYFKKIKCLHLIEKKYSINLFHFMENITWCDFKKSKVVTSILDISPLMYNHLPFLTFYQRFFYQINLKKTMNISNRILTISNSSKNDIIQYTGETKAPISVVYCALKQPNTTDLSVKHLEGKTFILIPCTYQYRKNLENMVLAFNNYVEKYNSEILLVITGQKKPEKNKVYSSLIKFIKKLKYKNLIYCLNGVNDSELNWLYSNAAFTYYVTFYEAFGFPIIESLSHGTPVLSGNIGSTQEIGKEYCTYCNPFDTNLITEKINAMITNGKTSKMSEAIQYVLKKFSIDKMCNNFIHIYESTII